MISIKHFSNFVPMEVLVRKAPLGLGFPCYALGNVALIPTSNQNIKTKL